MAELGLALGEAVRAHRRGDHARVVDLVWPARNALHRIGGSHAQRDFFVKLLIDAAGKAGRIEMARGLLSERLAARPHNRWARAERQKLALLS